MSEYQPSVTGGRDVHTVRFPDGVPPAELDVLIVGAGPVGLSSAIELAGRGVRVAVVDRARTATLIRAGAMGHSARTVEHFRRWGVLQEIRTEYEADTLRGNLGLPIPVNRYTAERELARASA